MLMLDIAVINSALPRVAVDLHASLSGVTWIIDAYTLALAATVLTTGSLADRFGRRRAFKVGLGVFTLSSIVCALSGNIATLDAARAVQGIGGAFMFSTSLALLATAYPDWTQRAKALAIYGATIGASFAVGPLVGGAMTSWFGWRSVFWLNVPVGVLCIIGAMRVGESRDPHARRPDWICSAATRSAGAPPPRSPSSSVPAPSASRSWPSRPASPSRCCRSACSRTAASPASSWPRWASPRRCSRSSCT
jgi:MFS family permease